jgi:hypothetical protein
MTADQTEPNEGRFVSDAPDRHEHVGVAVRALRRVQPARDGLPIALSGRYTTSLRTALDGIIGQQLGTTITLALITNQLAWTRSRCSRAASRGHAERVY